MLNIQVSSSSRKGAGSFPTALAVLSNLKDVLYNLAITKTVSHEIEKHSNIAEEEIYFIAGFDINHDFQNMKILEQEQDFLIAKSDFNQLVKLKQQYPNLYWVQIPQKTYDEITNMEVLN